jgi:hypothetical protein
VGGFNAAEAKATSLKRGMISFLACARIIPFANRGVILVQALDVLAQTLGSDSPHVATIEPPTSTPLAPKYLFYKLKGRTQITELEDRGD